MLDHISLAVADLKRSVCFYDAALKALGYRRLILTEWDAGWGPHKGGDSKFTICRRRRGIKIPGPGFHAAFSAPSRKAVDAFYRAAIRHGGKDNGGAGLHTEYGPNYYAAFVFDPDGYRIEAVIAKANLGRS